MSCIKKYQTIVKQYMWFIVLLMILAAAYYHWFGSIENGAEIEWFDYIIMTSILVILIVVLTFAGKRIYAKKQNISQQGFWNWQMPLWAVGGLTCIAVIQWLARLISCIRQVGLIPSLIFFGNILFTGRTCMSPWYAERLEENSPDIRLFWHPDNNNVYGAGQLYLINLCRIIN